MDRSRNHRHQPQDYLPLVTFGMRILLIVGIPLCLLLGMAGPSLAANKVNICHRPPDNPANFKIKRVGAPALPSHLAHGDNVVGPEVCDGVDNDCNGLVDDGIANLVSGSDVGECRPEIQECTSGSFQVVQSSNGPVAELCDGRDNDCDGTVDDGIANLVSGSDVGACQSEIQTCQNGAFVVTQAGITPKIEGCDTIDNDCDGLVDEDPTGNPLTQITTCGLGLCLGNSGLKTCTNGAFSGDTCDPHEGATDEQCDGLDNDCDGIVDDGITPIVMGSDVGECQLEIQECQNAQFVLTQPGINPSAEVCDNLDNDCDGEADEGLDHVETGTDEGECLIGISECDNGLLEVMQEEVEASPEICDGLDNDCDGTADEEGSSLCTDSVTCTTDSCNSGSCTNTANIFACNKDEICNPTLGCVPDLSKPPGGGGGCQPGQSFCAPQNPLDPGTS